MRINSVDWKGGNVYHTYGFSSEDLGSFNAGELNSSELLSLRTQLLSLLRANRAYYSESSFSTGIIFRPTKGGSYLSSALEIIVFNGNLDGSDTTVGSGSEAVKFRAGYCTVTEATALQNRASSSTTKFNETELRAICGVALSAYGLILGTYRKYTKVTNVAKKFSDLYAYSWTTSSGGPPKVYGFKPTSYLKKYSTSLSWKTSVFAKNSSTTSYYGVIHFIPQMYTGSYSANMNSMLAFNPVSLLFFKRGDTPTDTINNAINGKWYHVYSEYATYTINSNGEFTEKYGNALTILVNTSAAAGLFDNGSDLIIKEEEEASESDIDKTYPGGGDDQNPYPEDDDKPSGEGDFDNTNDPIDFPTLPTLDVQSTGFISVWNPTITEITNLYSWLWNADETILDTFSTTLKKMFSNPMEAIFMLGIVPVDPVTIGKREVTICHIATGIEMNSVQSQFVTFDFGSVDCTEYYGAAWDYSPYTKVSIYLPYIGVMDLDVDDVMNCTLTLRYNVDVVTGTVVALLKCKRKGRDNLDAVIYEWQGNCMTQCPITASDWSQKMASVLQLGAMTGLALMQPRAGQSTQNGEQNENPADVGKQLVSPTQYLNSALNVITSKVHVQRGGRLDLSAGAMSMQSAFLIINRPVSAIPRGWNKYAGYPSMKIKRLGSQEGFTKVAAIKLNGLQATSEEIQELDTILKAGVIL